MKPKKNNLSKIPATVILLLLTFFDLGLDTFFAGGHHCGEEDRHAACRGSFSSPAINFISFDEFHPGGQEHECIGCCHHVLTETIFDATPLLLLMPTVPQDSLPAIILSDYPTFHPPRS
jgi:hypothetical protein